MTMPEKINITVCFADGTGEWYHTNEVPEEGSDLIDGILIRTPYIRADIVEELVEKMKSLRDDAYGYDYLYETPFHGQVCEAIDAALSRYNAIMEGK